MKQFTRFFLAGVLLCLPLLGYSQQNNPLGMRWSQIRTKEFKLIYPLGYEQQAQRMAGVLQQISSPVTKTMGGRVRPVSIILQNQSAVSNGFVTLAPWRSEFFGMPPQDYNFVGTNDWLNLLAVHEYRHIVQFSRSVTGINKLMYYLFGQQGLAVSSFVAAPQWFWEGDAVVAETAFTNSGRGRMPYFNMLFRTNLQEGRIFNYNKQYLRSYKHNISDHYVLGYNMVAYLRTKTGDPEIWEKIAGRAWRTPFIPFTFSRAIRKETGLNVRQLYREMATDLSEQWKEESSKIILTPFEKINKRSSDSYTDYLYPQVLDSNRLVVIKKGIGDVDQLVILKNGEEEKNFVLGPVNSGAQLSVQKGKIVWNEFRFDPRWQVRNYSVIKTWDTQTNSKHQLTHRSRLAGSALSPDGTKVASIETTTNYETRLVVVEYATGKELVRFANPMNDALSMPRWDGNESILALGVRANLKSIVAFSLKNQAVEAITSPSEEHVGHPVPFGDYVLYNSSFSGIDNIYAVKKNTGVKFQVTNSRYGSLNPCISVDGKWIYYNEQTKNGLDVVRVKADPSTWQPIGQVTPYVDRINSVLAEQEGATEVVTLTSQKRFTSKPYRKWKGMINPHSWGPYANSSLSSINLGLSSRDILNTTSIEAGYMFDLSEYTGSWGVTASYQGLYPIIDFTFSTGDRQATSYYRLNDQPSSITFNWKEQTIKPTLRLPLLLTNSKFNRELVVKNGVSFTKVSQFTNTLDGFGREVTIANQPVTFNDRLDNGLLLTNEFELEFSNLMRRSRRDFQSKWGQRLDITAIGALRGSDFSAATTAATGYFYFPGLFKHHSFWTIGAYQHSQITYYPDNYFLRNKIPRPRGGFSYSPSEDFYFGSANYALPLWYPDLALGPLLTIQRVRANIFYDYGWAETKVNNLYRPNYYTYREYQSVGVELRLDGNLMRLLGQFDLGFRYSYQLSNQTPHFDIIIGSFGF